MGEFYAVSFSVFFKVLTRVQKKIAASRHSKKNSKKNSKTASRFSSSKNNCPCSKKYSDFHRKLHKLMFSGAVRRPRKKFTFYSLSRVVFLCFWAIPSLRTSQNKILNTIFKKIFRLFRRHSKKNSKKNSKTASRFSCSKNNCPCSKNNSDFHRKVP